MPERLQLNLDQASFILKDNEISLVGEYFDTLRAAVVRSMSGNISLIVDANVGEQDRISIYLQAVSHDILGHLDGPFANIIFPQDPNYPIVDSERLQKEHAAVLAEALQAGNVEELWLRPDFEVMYKDRKPDALAIRDLIFSKFSQSQDSA